MPGMTKRERKAQNRERMRLASERKAIAAVWGNRSPTVDKCVSGADMGCRSGGFSGGSMRKQETCKRFAAN